jgi:hypothetical protein
VVQQNVPSYRYTEEVRVGATLPSRASSTTKFQRIWREGLSLHGGERDQFLVDPDTRRVVQVIR